ncbi:hypothetical protein [Aliivibrio salmonicida]|uniref:hypothetical protein n=1 Tax=Aliivibrio salmonicida TaxID=40269 RepID=UPI003D0B4868
MDSIYYDNEPNHGVNSYFPWGHNYFRNMAEFTQFLEQNYGDDPYQLVQITDDNYQSLLLKGVFHAI